jgi:hypothetical protein
METLDAAVVDFRRRLAARHVDVVPARSMVAIRALQVLDERSREQMYWALRASLISRAEDIPGFDLEFDLFWHSVEPALQSDTPADHTPSGPRENLPSSSPSPESGSEDGGSAAATADEEPAEADQTGVVASPYERLGSLDFTSYSREDMLAARRLMWQLAGRLPQRRSRRLQSSSGPGHRLDVRGTLRTALRTDTELMHRAWRAPRTVQRPLVLLVDVSGSMSGYAVPLLLFGQAAIRHVRSAEAFTFGTRLTRVTPHLRRGSAEAAFRRATRAVVDWSGGTRIGESLRAFNHEWGGRGMAAGALVVIASDGWERGDPARLAVELGRLHRLSHALIWINPLAGDAGYQPLVRGMAAALPHVDGFQAANNLHSLQELVERLGRID